MEINNESIKRLPDISNFDIHSIAYLAFLEKSPISPEARLVYLHLKARSGTNQVIWFDKEKLWNTVGFKQKKYYDLIKELEKYEYIKQYARFDSTTGGRLPNAICVNPIDPYTGLPVTKQMTEIILKNIADLINTYTKNVIEKHDPERAKTYMGCILKEVPKSGRKKKTQSSKEDLPVKPEKGITPQKQKEELPDVNPERGFTTPMQKEDLPQVNAEKGITPMSETELPLEPKKELPPMSETDLPVNPESAELNNRNSIISESSTDNINGDDIKEDERNTSPCPTIPNYSFSDITNKVLEIFKASLPEAAFNTWIKDIVGRAYIESNIIVIPCMTEFAKEIVSMRYNDKILKYYADILDFIPNVEYRFES